MLFLVVVIIAGLAAYDQTELTSICDIYYSECETTTDCDYPSTGTNACDTYIGTATAACNSETSNHDFAKCFMNYNTEYFTNCTAYKYLSVCLFEETKDIAEFSCFNGGTTAVECPSTLSDGIEFNLQSVDYDADSVRRGFEYWTVLTTDFGTFNIRNPPDDCVTIGNRIACSINPWLLPHMNLHACLMTEEQKTCSCLMLKNTESNATVVFTDSDRVNPSDGPFDLPVTFNAIGTYRLIAHIQFYEDIGGDETIFWDLANGVDITVTDPDPSYAPTVPPKESGTDTGSLTAIIVCLSILSCYILLYVWYKYYYERKEFVFDEVDYELEQDQDEYSSELPVADAEDEFVVTGVQEVKAD